MGNEDKVVIGEAYDTDPDSPLSTVSRGRVITQSYTYNDLPDGKTDSERQGAREQDRREQVEDRPSDNPACDYLTSVRTDHCQRQRELQLQVGRHQRNLRGAHPEAIAYRRLPRERRVKAFRQEVEEGFSKRRRDARQEPW